MVATFPNELVERILLALEPAGGIDSAQALCRLQQTSRRLHAIASSDNVWRMHYLAGWQHSRAIITESYMEAYKTRTIKDQRALDHLERICFDARHRLPRFEELSDDLRMDVYDCVNKVRLDLNDFRDWQELAKRDDAWLAKHYWASEVRSFVLRRHAIRLMSEINLIPPSITFETGLPLFSLFKGSDPQVIQTAINAFADRCKIHLAALIAQKDLMAVVFGIREYMGTEGFRAASPDHFHDLENNFIGTVLEGKKPSLPMTLVWIFIATAQRLGIAACAIGFPTTVIARIDGWSESPANEQEQPIYYNIFYHQIATKDRLEEVLLSSGLPRELHPELLDRANTRDIVLRSARNIYNSLGMVEGDHNRENLFEASYASAAAIIMLDPTAAGRPLVDLLTTTIEVRFPYDAGILAAEISRWASPNLLAGTRLQDVADVVQNVDELGPVVRDRDRAVVKHKVGQVYMHKLYGYRAVILDYNAKCDASQEWQRAMNIRALNRKADQPFYHSLVDDGSTRYVADENIVPLTKISSDLVLTIIAAHPSLGRFFRNADMETGCFLLSADLQFQHPDN